MDIGSLRRGMGLTQAEFAKELGVSMAYVGHLETGVRKPSIKLAAKIEKLTGVYGLVAARVAEKAAA